MKSIIRNIFMAATVGVLTLQHVDAQQKLSLQESVTLAEQQNPEIAISKLEIEKAKQQRVISRSLFLPSIGASAQLAHYFQRNPFFGFGESTSSSSKIPYGRFGGDDQFVAFISAVQPLYNPQAFPSARHSRLLEEESKVSASSKRIETLSQVKQTYLQILVLQERIQLQRESINRNHRVLQDARSLFAQGKGLRVDTLRAYTAVRNLEPDLLKLNYAVETSKLRLKSLIGIDSLQDIQLTDSLFLPSAGTIPSEEEVYQAAKNSNPNYQLLNLREETSEQQASIASSARLPVVSLVGQYQLQSQTNSLEYGNAYYPSSSFVGLQLSVPIFTGLSNQAKVRQARLSNQQSTLTSKHAYEELQSLVHHVVADSYESLARLKTSVDVKETAALSYDIVQYRYKKGISSRLELTDAELELSTAQSNYLEAVYDYLTARIALDSLMGRVE
jgi:outer membrane protein TolC